MIFKTRRTNELNDYTNGYLHYLVHVHPCFTNLESNRPYDKEQTFDDQKFRYTLPYNYKHLECRFLRWQYLTNTLYHTDEIV